MPDTTAPAGAPALGPVVAGYRQLSDSEIALMNRIKATEAHLAELVSLVRITAPQGEPQRQAALAITAFEEGFMRLVRAVAQPANPFIRHAAATPAPIAASVPPALQPVVPTQPTTTEAAA